MPAAVTFIAAGAGGAAAAAAAGYGIGAVIAFQAVSMVIMTAISRRMMDKKSRQVSNQTERQFTARATDGPETFIYGRALVPGLTVYNNALNHPESTYDTPNYDMFHAVVWACHRCNSIQYFRLDDTNLDPSVTSISWDPVTYTGSGMVETGKFRGSSLTLSPTAMRWYLGNQTSADAVMMYFAPEWTNAHVGRERTYGVFHVTQINRENNTDKVFDNGIPTNVSAYVHGKSVYDHRKNALNADPTFLNISSNWNGVSLNSGDTFHLGITSWSPVQGVGGYEGALDHGAGIVNTSSHRYMFGTPFNVDARSQFSLRVAVRQPSLPVGSGTAALAISFWDGNGRNIPVGSSNAAGFTLSTFHYFAFVNTNFPSQWTEVAIKVGSGQAYTIPSCASFARLVVEGNRTSTSSTVQQVQDFAMWLGSASRNLVNVDSTWQYSENPAMCTADYLRNELFGFGKEMRLRVNPSRFSKNNDPGWRRIGTLGVVSFWNTSAASGAGSTLASAGASLSLLTGAPVGRTSLTLTASGASPASAYLAASQRIPIDPTGVYYLTIRARQDGTRGNHFGATYLTANGAVISNVNITSIQQLSSTWSKYYTTIGSGTGNAIPSSARLLSLFATAPYSFGANGATTVFYQDFRCMVGSQDRNFIEPYEQINWRSVSSAAAYCDGVVVTPSGAQARFTCNGAGNTGQSYRDVIRDMLMSGNLRLTYSQSGFNMYGGWGQPAFTINRSDLKGAMEIRGAADTRDRYNAVRGTFFDRHADGKKVPFGTASVVEYRARDNSMQLFEDLDLGYTHDWWEAQRVAFAVLDQGDNQMVGRVQVGMRGFGLAVGQHVAVQNHVMSWSPKYFVLTGAEYSTEPGPRQGVSLNIREDFQQSYVDPSLTEYIHRDLGNISSASPNVPMVSSVQAIPRIEAVELRWVNPAQRAFEWVDIYRATVNSFGASALLASVRGDRYVDEHRVSDQLPNYYWWRTRDVQTNQSSVFPGVNSGLSGYGVFSSPRDPDYVFFDEFNYKTVDQFEEKWEKKFNFAEITFPFSGEVGGQVLQVGSEEAWYISRARIPYDPDRMYRMTVKAKLVASESASRRQDFGVACYEADGRTLIDVNSSVTYVNQHHFVKRSYLPTSLGVWETHTGLMRGHMAWPQSGTVWGNNSRDPLIAARAHPKTRYISPAFGFNLAIGKSVHQVDYISLAKEEFPSGLVLDPHITIGTSQWMTQYPSNQAITNHYTTALSSEYNYFGVNSQVSGFVDIFERLDTRFHTVMPTSFRFGWQARIYVSSFSGAPPTVRMIIKGWTRTGTTAGGGSNTTLPVTPGLGRFPFNQWVDISGEGFGGISSADLATNPGLRYMTAGIELFDMTNARSVYLTYLNARVL